PFLMGINQESMGTGSRADLIAAILRDGVLFRWYPIEHIRDLISSMGMESHASNQIDVFQAATLRLDMLWYGLIGLFFAGCGMLWQRRWRHLAIFVWLWAFITLIVFIPAWTGSGVFHHYFVPSIPAFMLLIAAGLVGLYDILAKSQPGRFVGIGLYVLFGIVIINQAIWGYSLNRFRTETYLYSEQTRQTATPLQYLSPVREALQDFDDVIIAGGNPHESNYYIWQPMLYETASCVRDLLLVDGEIDILPTGRFAVIVPPLNPYNTFYNVPERYQHDKSVTFDLRPGEDPYVLYAFESAPDWTESDLIDVSPAAFDSGVTLNGYALTASQVQLRWYVDEVSGVSYQYFVHFLDETGERIGQRDAPFYVGQHWCENDTLITTASIDLPDNTTTLRIGMYRFKDDGGTESQILRDNPASKWVDIAITDD
ncbi:MAG: hypothetical protein ACPG7F_13370, partial [Aggregatilineales bacterium]